MKHSSSKQRGGSASELISKRIAELDDWRGEVLARIRGIIKQADPDIVEEWKWMGTPVFSHDGIVCTGETYKSVVKMTFAKGAFLEDPSGLFNSSLEGNVRRAIDIRQGEKLDVRALKALIREAVAYNRSGKKAPPFSARTACAEDARRAATNAATNAQLMKAGRMRPRVPSWAERRRPTK